mmetsp:Transcript_74165/g.197771  ORF Transcript_74165/g.197771 Transcript_74165/m.197771 type:complete len:324 (-) Transcript_74165:49-1020(-)
MAAFDGTQRQGLVVEGVQVHGMYVQDYDTAAKVKKVLYTSLCGAVIVIVAAIWNCSTQAQQYQIAEEAQEVFNNEGSQVPAQNNVWSYVVGALIGLVVPACGYFAAKNRNSGLSLVFSCFSCLQGCCNCLSMLGLVFLFVLVKAAATGLDGCEEWTNDPTQCGPGGKGYDPSQPCPDAAQDPNTALLGSTFLSAGGAAAQQCFCYLCPKIQNGNEGGYLLLPFDPSKLSELLELCQGSLGTLLLVGAILEFCGCLVGCSATCFGWQLYQKLSHGGVVLQQPVYPQMQAAQAQPYQQYQAYPGQNMQMAQPQPGYQGGQPYVSQ